jgi:hypothetical protein
LKEHCLMKISHRKRNTGFVCLSSAVALGALWMATRPAAAQVNPGDVDRTVGQAGNAASSIVGQTGQTAGQLENTVGSTVGQLGNTTGNVVGGLQPTLQPVGQGLGNALNNLTQPDTVSSLLEFLAGVIPNHIEAHVNLDSLRVEKVTLDIRGVDLRNLRVDLLVANSRNAGQVRPAMGPGSMNGATSGTGAMNGTGSVGAMSSSSSGNTQLPGDVSINGASTRQR